MLFINKQDDYFINSLISIFKLAMKNSYCILSENAFRFDSANAQRRPINMILFETIGYILSVELNKDIDLIDLKNNIAEFKVNTDASSKFAYIDMTSSVEKRFSEADKIREKLLNA